MQIHGDALLKCVEQHYILLIHDVSLEGNRLTNSIPLLNSCTLIKIAYLDLLIDLQRQIYFSISCVQHPLHHTEFKSLTHKYTVALLHRTF
jgi:hypothetical protein